MKKLMSISILLCMSLFVLGQEDGKRKPSPQERAAKQTERMVKDLNLSPEQAAEVGKYNEMTAIHLHQLREDQKAEKEKKREEAKAIRAEHDTYMQSILNKDQYPKWKSIQEQRKEERMAKKVKKKKAMQERARIDTEE